MTPSAKPNPQSKVISDRDDKQIRQVRALQTRGGRERTGQYYIEGVRFVAQATTFNAEIETVAVCHPLLKNPLGRKLFESHKQKGTTIIEVTAEVFRHISSAVDPQGIGAVVRQKWLSLDRVKLGGKLCWIALDTMQSPGNLGTILRTSDVVGGAGLILLSDSVDPYDPATVRATMGALLSQRFVRTTPAELARWKDEREWLLVGTSPTARVDYQAVDYHKPTILLVGGEKKGLSPELQGICDLIVRIPMVGHSDSLNVAIATGVMLYEMFNQKRARRTIKQRK
jgi:TrmH family RNA methyltransferase